MIDMLSYQGIDRWSRNARLYKSLCDIGLVVVPVYTADGSGRIDALYVTADLPTEIGVAEDPASSWHARYAPSQNGRVYGGGATTPLTTGMRKQSDTIIPFPRR